MIEELIKRVVTSVGIPESLAQTAVGLILGMFQKHGDAGHVSSVLDAIPGAADLIKSTDENTADDGGSGGGLGGLMGMAAGMMGGDAGGIMETVSKLQNAGLDLDQAKSVGEEVVGFAKEKAGDEAVEGILSSIPGLDQIM